MNDGTCNRCGIPAVMGEWCWEHSVRWLLTGDPDGVPPKILFPSCEPGERWLPVTGYEENYLVSNRGRIWSRPRYKTPGGLMRLQRHPYGYWQVGLTATDGTQQTQKVHVLVVRAFEGPCPPHYSLVRHLNGDPTDNRWPENVCWGNPPQNGEDMVRHGRSLNANKTHCPKRHPYDEENTYIVPSTGGRVCKICNREQSREGQRRLKERRKVNGPWCSRDGCNEPIVGRGLCNRHYKQWQKGNAQ